MRRLVLDFEDVLNSVTHGDQEFCDKIRAYRDLGFEIVVSRASTPSSGGKVSPSKMLSSLEAISSLCDTVVFGKPAAEMSGLVLDDKAVTLEEFMAHGYNELRDMMDKS